jgi:hypothetical protein
MATTSSSARLKLMSPGRGARCGNPHGILRPCSGALTNACAAPCSPTLTS